MLNVARHLLVVNCEEDFVSVLIFCISCQLVGLLKDGENEFS